MNNNETIAEYRARARREQRRDMKIAAAIIIGAAGLFADLVAHGPHSLYGRLFLWLVSLG